MRIINKLHCFIIINFLLFQSIVLASDFTVLTVKGQVQYKEEKAKNWQNIRTGTKLKLTDQIKVPKDSYIGLMHKGGRAEEISKDGTYKLSDIYNEISKRKSSVTQRFTQFVVEEMSSSEDLLAKSSYKTQMGATGAVTRAAAGEEERMENVVILTGGTEQDIEMMKNLNDFSKTVGENLIVARYPRDSYIIDQRITFSWQPKKNVNVYNFVIEDEKGNKVFEKATSNTEIFIDLKEIGAQKDKNYYWYVYSDKCSSNEYCINWINTNNNKVLRDEIIPLINELSTQPKAIDCLSLASYLADLNIMHKAIEFYNKAIKIAPDIYDYKRVYATYLFRIGLDNEAIELLKY